MHFSLGHSLVHGPDTAEDGECEEHEEAKVEPETMVRGMESDLSVFDIDEIVTLAGGLSESSADGFFDVGFVHISLGRGEWLLG